MTIGRDLLNLPKVGKASFQDDFLRLKSPPLNPNLFEGE